ncbi:NAD(+) synthase [Caulobacter sp. S45]|uniref:NAD(+) synthase n=1 Tax=Caulobacter sp. S45 TaxID=1641861 RepID=UPI0020B14425|nr:NAD(+) synthase [Caulobacter sp. S45]
MPQDEAAAGHVMTQTLPFDSPYAHGLIRLGVCVPRLRPADPVFNTDQMLDLVRRGDRDRAALLLFPELGVSAYAIDDLLQQGALLEAVQAQLARLVEASREVLPVIVVGAPLLHGGRLYNTAVAIYRGKVLGVVPKLYLPNYREFYERRHFASGSGMFGAEIDVAGTQAPFGLDLLFRAEGASPFTFHMEICEDVWTANPPSGIAAVAGAELLLNLSASNIVIGKAEMRKLLCASQSARCIAAYAYSAAGPGESTTDLAWDGQASVFEMGDDLVETERFARESTLAVVDVDLGRIRSERMRTGSWGDSAVQAGLKAPPWRTVRFDFAPPTEPMALKRKLERFPYVPSDPARLAADCYEAWNIQVQGLTERLRAAGVDKLVIGVSGGLDSTEALVVAVKSMDLLGLPRTNVLAYTLPGFATSDGTKSNAWTLMKALGVSAAELDIRPAARQMLADLDHPFARGEKVYDVTFENVQAGLRTDYLFRLANRYDGIVLGTGDLSELGLGWCTYGVGDQMSHYNPNGSVSKTLIQHLIRFAAESGEFGAEASAVMHAIVATEISPELVPAGEDGKGQSTEAMVGPYPLQDFNLFYFTRYGFKPSKIAYLAWQAWRDAGAGEWPRDIPADARRAYDLAEIKRWLALFLKRFFANQFKRSAMPNGPKITSGGSLSPRGDWRMPSDASPAVWLAELEANVPD